MSGKSIVAVIAGSTSMTAKASTTGMSTAQEVRGAKHSLAKPAPIAPLAIATALALSLALATGCPKDDVEPTADAQIPDPHWRSVLFPEGWTPDHQLPDGRFLHDFSYAGYRAGEEPLPEALPTPILSVLDQGADPSGALDSTGAIQATIDALSGGGTALIPEGLYRVDGELLVQQGGVVISGEGPDKTFLHFTREPESNGLFGLGFRGRTGSVGEWPLAEDALSRSFAVKVQDASGLAPGDPVALGIVITDEFRSEHGMEDYWSFSAGQWRAFARRTVVAIQGDEVLLDVPVRYAAKVRDGASLRPDDGYLREVGLVDLSLSTAVAEEAAWAVSRHSAVLFDRVADAWITRVRSFAPEGFDAHLQSGGLRIERSRRVTIAFSEMGFAQNRGGGGNGYLFEIGQSNEILIQDSIGRSGRHNFIQNWDFGTSGCVFLRTLSVGGLMVAEMNTTGSSEYHHALAHANLVDQSVTDDGWGAINRRSSSSGAGHTATESVFWNLRGAGTLRCMQYGWGYVIGTGPELTTYYELDEISLLLNGSGTAPEDHAEGLGQAEWLLPQSLYEDQLERRLAR
ncbi:MAG: glycosyl hydrolase family 28-related protein [Polyangia bacterium]|mgnify:CR=1 FL=1|jgi:hypothetical protein|nr:glycosyl hydrolase family 28-related protein [Polyangia bacterium]